MKQIQRAYKKADGMYGDWEDITVRELGDDVRKSNEFDSWFAMEKLCDAQAEGKFLETRYAFYRFAESAAFHTDLRRSRAEARS